MVKLYTKTLHFQTNSEIILLQFLDEFDEAYIKNFEAHLKNRNFVKQENNMIFNELDYIENRKGNIEYVVDNIKDINVGKYYSVGFLNDIKSLIIKRVSW